MAKTIEKTLACTVNETRENEHGLTNRVTLKRNELEEGGVNTTLKLEFKDAVPSEWSKFLKDIEIGDTMIIAITTGMTQGKL